MASFYSFRLPGTVKFVYRAVYVEGLRSKQQEDPRRQNKFLLGLLTEMLVCVVTKRRWHYERWWATVVNMQFGSFCPG